MIQVAIVPCGITVNLKDEERSGLYAACKEYEDALVEAGVRVKGDYRENYSPGDHVIKTTLQRLGQVRVKGDYCENYSSGDHVIKTTLQRLGWVWLS